MVGPLILNLDGSVSIQDQLRLVLIKAYNIAIEPYKERMQQWNENNVPIATRALVNSGIEVLARSLIDPNGNFQTFYGFSAEHTLAAEMGSPPGTVVEIAALTNWARAKGIPENAVPGIAAHIFEHGTRRYRGEGKPFINDGIVMAVDVLVQEMILAFAGMGISSSVTI